MPAVGMPAVYVPLPWGNGEQRRNALPVVNAGGGRTAMAGPVYYFDPDLKSEHRLPKEFDHTLFIYEWSRNWIIAVHLDADPAHPLANPCSDDPGVLTYPTVEHNRVETAKLFLPQINSGHIGGAVRPESGDSGGSIPVIAVCLPALCS